MPLPSLFPPFLNPLSTGGGTTVLPPGGVEMVLAQLEIVLSPPARIIDLPANMEATLVSPGRVATLGGGIVAEVSQAGLTVEICRDE